METAEATKRFPSGYEAKMEAFSSDHNWAALLAKATLEGRRRPAQVQDDPFPWPSCQDFTVDVGKEHIDAYIKTWELRPRWLYSLDFLFSTEAAAEEAAEGEEEQHDARFYHYRARFSTPTAREPIPDTVSVYFLVKVTTAEAPPLPVEVRFIVESNRLVHAAGDIRFSEKWLSYVIHGKALFRRMFALHDAQHGH